MRKRVAASYLEYELFVAVPATSLSEETEDVATDLKKEIKKLRRILDIYENVVSPKTKKKGSRFFDDVELHVWDIQHGDDNSVDGATEGSMGPDSIVDAWDDISGDIEEEEKETSLVLILRSSVDANTTLISLEQQISEELKAMEGSFEHRPTFVTLIA